MTGNAPNNPHDLPTKSAWEKYRDAKNLFDKAQSSKEIINKTGELIADTIYNIITRWYPQKETPTKKITWLDAYFIPDNLVDTLSDDDLFQILAWLLCKPQYFGQDQNTWEWIITNDWLVELNNILDSAARHTMRQIQEAAMIHSKKYINSNTNEGKKERWIRSPEDELDTTWFDLNRYWISYFKNNFKKRSKIRISPNNKKRKMYFEIKSLSDYLDFVRSLISQKKTKKNEYDTQTLEEKKEFSRLQHDWMFLKNIIAYSNMNKNDGYISKRTHLFYIIKNIFRPFLQNTNDKFETHIKELENHEFEFTTRFSIKAYWKELKWKFILNTKGQASIIDKLRRDPSYSTSSSLKDTIRWSIIMENQEDLILMMHYFAKYFIQNPERNFDHSIFNDETHTRESEEFWFDPIGWILRNLIIKDKWILNSTNINLTDLLPKWTKPKEDTSLDGYTNDNLDRAATKYLLNSSKNSEKKSTTSKQYVDTKYTIPIIMKWSSYSMELKFMTKTNEKMNNKWLSHHSIMRLKQLITLRSRDQKFVRADQIRSEINRLLKNNQLRSEIEEQITSINHNQQSPEDYLYSEITNKLTILKYKQLPDWSLIPTHFCDKTIRKNLADNKYNINSIEDNKQSDTNKTTT